MSEPGRDKLLTSVGEALVAWGKVEFVLSSLFHYLSDIQEWQKAYTIFDTIISFDTRVDVIDALMAKEANDELEKVMWEKLSDRLRKYYKKRHQLAHFQVGERNGEPLIGPFFTVGNFIADNIKYLSLSDIEQRSQTFSEQSAALTWFWFQAGSRRGLHGDTKVPDAPLIGHLRELAILTLQERARRQQSSPP